MFQISKVPGILDRDLEKRCKQMQPVVRFRLARGRAHPGLRGTLCYIEPTDPRRTSFLDYPVTIKPANDLIQLAVIQTIHSTGLRGHRPSVAEVIAQIPPTYIDDVVAFESGRFTFLPKATYTVANTILYKSARTGISSREFGPYVNTRGAP
jgi:hypothetical protein